MPLTNRSESQVARNLTDADALTLGEDTAIEFRAMPAPPTPPSGAVLAYAGSDGRLHAKNDAGTEFDLTAGATTLIELSDVDAKTGTGTTVVMQGSPTLTTPVIADFSSAMHSHQNAAGGGTLDAAAIAAGTLDSARLAAKNKTRVAKLYIENPAATDEIPMDAIPDAATIVRVVAATDAGTANFNIEVRSMTTPYTAASNIFGAEQTAGNGASVLNTTTITTPAVGADSWLHYSASTGGSGATKLWVWVEYKID
jgi:hypothetical protein